MTLHPETSAESFYRQLFRFAISVVCLFAPTNSLGDIFQCISNGKIQYFSYNHDSHTGVTQFRKVRIDPIRTPNNRPQPYPPLSTKGQNTLIVSRIGLIDFVADGYEYSYSKKTTEDGHTTTSLLCFRTQDTLLSCPDIQAVELSIFLQMYLKNFFIISEQIGIIVPFLDPVQPWEVTDISTTYPKEEESSPVTNMTVQLSQPTNNLGVSLLVTFDANGEILSIQSLSGHTRYLISSLRDLDSKRALTQTPEHIGPPRAPLFTPYQQKHRRPRNSDHAIRPHANQHFYTPHPHAFHMAAPYGFNGYSH